MTQTAIPLVQKLVAEINKIHPDLVVNLGDTVEDEKDKAQNIKNLEIIWREFKKINPPFYCVCGNHDIMVLNRKSFSSAIGYRDMTYSIDLCGYHLMFLSVGDEPAKYIDGKETRKIIPKGDLEWLLGDIEKNNLPSIAFLHHPIAESDLKGNFWFEGNREGGLLQNRAELKNVLKTDPHLFAVFCGHQHWTKTIVEDGIPHHIVGSLTENVDGHDVPDGVWLEVDIDGKDIKIKEHHLKL